MSHVRACLRLVAFLAWSSGGLLAAAAVRGVGHLWPRAGARWHAVTARTWARGVAAILDLRVTVHGSPPPPPFVLVCNHLGYVDIVTLMSQVPGVFVAKAEVAGWPFLGLLARVAGTIFVDRGSRRDVVRVNTAIAGALHQGRGVVMFPEGTSSRGAEVLPFRSSLLEPAVRSGHPVSYASLSYDTPKGAPAAGQAVCWWGEMTFPDHFYGLLRLPHILADLSFGQTHVHAADRRELARSLQDAVSRLFRPVGEARCA